MRLPQEIYDYIIDHLHKDKPSLHHCSLVSRGWAHRSQANLLRTLILEDKLWQRWLDTFSPSNQRTHSLVKALILFPPIIPDCLAEYAPAFRNLEHRINGTNAPYKFLQLQCIRWFGHLRSILKGFHLNGVTVNPRVIAEFPLLEYLIVQYSRMPYVDGPDEGDDIPEPNFHGPSKVPLNSTSILVTPK